MMRDLWRLVMEAIRELPDALVALFDDMAAELRGPACFKCELGEGFPHPFHDDGTANNEWKQEDNR